MWDCCGRYQEREVLLQPLLTLSLSWLAGGTGTLALGTHTSAVMLPPARHSSCTSPTERDQAGDWGGQGCHLEEINQCSHGTELFILQPGTRRAYPEHSQSLGVPDSRRTPRSCRQPCACPAGAEMELQHPGSSIPPAFPFSLSPPAHAALQAESAHHHPGTHPQEFLPPHLPVPVRL